MEEQTGHAVGTAGETSGEAPTQTAPAPAPAAKTVDPTARSLRRGALLAGVPLLLTLVVPWFFARDWLFTWELADRIDAPFFMLFPAAGLVLLFAAFAQKTPYGARALLLLVAASTLLWTLHTLLDSGQVARELSYELRHVDRGAFELLFLAPVLAAAGELAMQLRKRSRLLSGVAVLGWLHLLGRYAVPLRPGDFESSPAGAMVEMVDHLERDPAVVLLLVPLLLLFSYASVGAFLAFIRMLSPREKMEKRWFPWGCMTVVLIMPPVLLGLPLLLLAVTIDGDPEAVPSILGAGAILWGVLVGSTWGLAHGAAAMGDGLGAYARDLRSEDARARRRARVAIALLGLALVGWLGWKAYRVFGPDPREGAVVDLAEELSGVVVEAAMGRPYDERFHGGYSEYDLRGSRGALAEAAGADAEIEPVLLAFELTANVEGMRFAAKLVALSGGPLRWARIEPEAWPESAHPLELAHPAFGDAAGLTADGLGSFGCLPTLSEDDLRGVPVSAAGELLALSPSVAAACRSGGERDGGGIGGGGWSGPSGALGPMRLIVRANGAPYALDGRFYNDAGRLWIGRVTVTPL